MQLTELRRNVDLTSPKGAPMRAIAPAKYQNKLHSQSGDSEERLHGKDDYCHLQYGNSTVNINNLSNSP